MSQVSIIDIEGNHPQIPTQFDANIGFAIPLANVLEIYGDTALAGSTPVYTEGTGNNITTYVQISQAIASTDATNVGLAAFDSSMFTVDANGFVQLIGGSDAIDSITGDDGAAVFPDGAGNLNFIGAVVANATHAKPLYFDGTAAANTQTLELQVATALGSAPIDYNDAGICSFHSSQFSVDANGFVQLAGGSVAVDSNTGDDSVAVFPDAVGNFNWIGNAVANATHAKPVYFKDSATANAIDLDIQVAVDRTGAPGDKNDAGLASFDDTYFTVDADGYVSQTTAAIDTAMANFIVDPNGTRAEYTTISAAMTAASSGDTIGVKPGTYTEDLTMKAGVALVALYGQSQLGNVEIIGKLSFTDAGDYAVSGLTLTTNTDYCVSITGTNALNVYMDSCFVNAADNDAILVSNANAELVIDRSRGNILTTGIRLWDVVAGKLEQRRNRWENTGASTTASRWAGNAVSGLHYSQVNFPMAASGSSFVGMQDTHVNCSNLNVTAITNTSGGTLTAFGCSFSSGTAPACTATSSLGLRDCQINSNNTNAIDGAGTLTYGALVFTGTSSNISTTTQTLLYEGPSKTIGSSNAGNTNTLLVTNDDNTSVTSNASLTLQTGGTSGGDPYLRWNVPGGQDYSLGIDNNASDVLKLTDDATPTSGNTLLQVNSVGNVTVGYARSGQLNSIIVQNTDNTSTATGAYLRATVGGTSAGNPYTSYIITGGSSWATGVANQTDDEYTIAASGTLGSNKTVRITTAGEVTMPLQPAFLAVNSTSDTNQTGAGTLVSPIEFDTEVFDQNGDYDNTTDTFTAPVTGRYQLSFSVGVTSLTALMSQGTTDLVTSNRTYQMSKLNIGAIRDGTNNIAIVTGSVIADMDAGDTAIVRIRVSNGAGDTAGIQGGNNNTFFCGCLLA